MYEYYTVSDPTVALPWNFCEVLGRWQAAKQHNFQWDTLLGGGGETIREGE